MKVLTVISLYYVDSKLRATLAIVIGRHKKGGESNVQWEVVPEFDLK